MLDLDHAFLHVIDALRADHMFLHLEPGASCRTRYYSCSTLNQEPQGTAVFAATRDTYACTGWQTDTGATMPVTYKLTSAKVAAGYWFRAQNAGA